MGKGTSSLSVATGKTEKFVAPDLLKMHRVYYRAHQVGCSLRAEAFMVGLRVAVLEHRSDFAHDTKPPVIRFYTGVVERIWGNPNDPLVTIKYDGHPYALSISFGIKQNCQFCIAIPPEQPKTKKRRKRPE